MGFTYPWWEIHLAFLSNELQDTRMRSLPSIPIDQLEVHGIFDVKSCEFLEGRGWETDLATIVDMITLWPLEHDSWIHSIVFIESPRRSSSSSTVLHHSQECSWIVTSEVLVVGLEGLLARRGKRPDEICLPSSIIRRSGQLMKPNNKGQRTKEVE
jgi:hypothetical protein